MIIWTLNEVKDGHKIATFPEWICELFPLQTERHIASVTNARWMLRNRPSRPLDKNEKQFLISFIKIMGELQ